MSALDARGLRARAQVLAVLRAHFAEGGYLEVPTPTRVPSPALEANLYGVPVPGGWLRTSPEMALKRVVASGLPRVYEIGPCFRGEERGPWHGGEFLLAEWYRAGAHLNDLAAEVEQIVSQAAGALHRPAPTWQRTTVADLFRVHVGVELATATAHALHPQEDDWEHAFYRRWVETIEPTLTEGAWFVFDWPASQAALAAVQTRQGVPVGLRFEAYVNGLELANAFQELGESAAIRARFATSGEARAARGEDPHPVDEAFLQALDRLPPCAGIALGVERLVASLMGWRSLAPGRADHPDDAHAPLDPRASSNSGS